MQLQSLLETVCALFNIPEHIAAIIHQTGLLTSIPGTDFQMGQKEVNHFVVVFIGQCLLILLLCQIKRVITSTKLQIHFKVDYVL